MLGWVSMVLPGSVLWKYQPLPQPPRRHWQPPGRDTAQDQSVCGQGSAADTGWMLRGPWTGGGRALG